MATRLWTNRKTRTPINHIAYNIKEIIIMSNRILLLLLLLALGSSLAACSKQDLKRADYQGKSEGQVSFLTSSYDFDLTYDATSVSCPISRGNTSGAFTFPVKAFVGAPTNPDKGKPIPEGFTLATPTVTFADGERNATLTLNYDYTKLDFAAGSHKINLLVDAGEKLSEGCSNVVTLTLTTVPNFTPMTNTASLLSAFAGTTLTDIKLEQAKVAQFFNITDPYGKMPGGKRPKTVKKPPVIAVTMKHVENTILPFVAKQAIGMVSDSKDSVKGMIFCETLPNCEGSKLVGNILTLKLKFTNAVPEKIGEFTEVYTLPTE